MPAQTAAHRMNNRKQKVSRRTAAILCHSPGGRFSSPAQAKASGYILAVGVDYEPLFERLASSSAQITNLTGKLTKKSVHFWLSQR